MTAHSAAIYQSLADRIAERANPAKRCGEGVTIGLCGAQGSGKTTLIPILKRLLMERGLTTAGVSLDDFYLPLDARQVLARTVHPLLKTRGVPGTHDVALALHVLIALRGKGLVSLPAFDKALDDRRPPSEWLSIEAPVDVTLFEGWCVGARPQFLEALAEPVNSLERDEDATGIWRRYVNETLATTYRPLFAQIDFLVLLAAPNFEVVYRWRIEQERSLRNRLTLEQGDLSRLMNERELVRFISHYERLTRHVLMEMPSRADVVVHLDCDRRMNIPSEM